jgi:uncharacterized protein (TIGR02246 family)
MDRGGSERWLAAYFAAWVSNDPAEVAALFTDDAGYWVGPYAEPWVGREAIVEAWTSGSQVDVEHVAEVLAIDGDRVVAHWNVKATDPATGVRSELDGVLLLTFVPDGRCREHREWFARREIPRA